MGVSAAKALAAARRLPLAPVDHLHGHVTAAMLGDDPIEPPYLCLVASGGHTFLARVDDPSAYRVLGQTLDDAAGEAFDKGARLLGLGYPGGPEIDRLAREGDPTRVRLPALAARRRARLPFSGLKTSLLYKLRDQRRTPDRSRTWRRPTSARSWTRSIARLEQAVEREGLERVALGGGVAANRELRERRVARLGVRGSGCRRSSCARTTRR